MSVSSKNIIMLVEDNEDHLELTISALKEANMKNNIVALKDGREAIAYLKGEGEYSNRKAHPLPMLILLDLKMPRVGGKEVLKVIKGDERLRTIPVVMLTSSAMEKDIEDCYDLGANSYIVKPVSFGDFVEKVKSIPLYWLLINSLPEVNA
ncbi:MAG: response regulator [Thermoplasmata archaeon]|nr:response regulator [Thermoplasmata archaeon]